MGPQGGGARTLRGKLFGTRQLGTSPLTLVDTASGDLRAVAIVPEEMSTSNQSGAALMSAIPSVNLRISPTEATETRVVSSYQLGMLGGSGLRDAYVLFRFKDVAENAWIRDVLVGRFNVPFGIQTDEHRTYVRVQNKSTIYDFEMGVLASGDQAPYFHADLGLTTGFQLGGNFASQDVPYAILGNFRFGAPGVPLFLGWSGMLHRSLAFPYLPYSTAVYAGLSLDRLTSDAIQGSVLAEVQLARGWNDSARNPSVGKFIADPAYEAAVRDSQSSGTLVLLAWDASRRWSLFYKYDRLAFDRRFSGDQFIRHGIGAKYWLNAAVSLSARYEHSFTDRAELERTRATNTRDNGLFVLYASF